MPDILPFSGIRYNPLVVHDMVRVVAPPYDVIDPEQHQELLDADPYNCVRLILGSSPGRPGDYQREADRMAQWLSEGILIRDPAPRFYLIEDAFQLAGEPSPRRRWGIIGRVRLESLDSGRIHPHERTHSGPKEDRLRLMKAFRGNLSQVFALFDGDSAGIKAALGGVFDSPPALDITDREGIGRRMWVIDDSGLVDSISEQLSRRNLYIADGHHRYETALAYSQEMALADREAGPDMGYRFVAMALVGLEDPGLAILPTHRLLHSLDGFDFSRLTGCLAESFALDDVEPEDGESIRAGSAPDDGIGRGFILYDPSKDRLVRATLREDVDLAARMPDLPQPVRELDVTLAERMVMMDCLGMTPEQISHQENLEYFKDVRKAMEKARSQGQVLIIMRPTGISDLIAVTGARERMPQKSTFFFPKMLSGVVFYPHDP
ncbi:MAG: DUF1015 domain-containing protein [bacterium]|nr:MAG: DUF1015 domain-containing protein [bacterium]